MAMTLLLAAGRRLIEGDAYARSPEFTTYDPGYMLGREIHGSTIGIIGMGRIGSQIAKRARGFDMRVLYHNRTRREADEAQYQATYCSLDDLLDQSDYVVVVTPLTAETKGLIDRPQFERMKSSAILVNIARGPIVSTDALTWALQEGQIYAAGLDVTDPEPLPRDHPLLSCKNLTIAPHLGSGTEQTRQRMAEVSVENLLAGLAGKPLVHQVG
jgi:glyoxylate reductase